MVKTAMLSTLRRVLQTDEGRTLLISSLNGSLAPRPCVPGLTAAPYPELGRAECRGQRTDESVPVFITARFRTGSTLLWNLFRHVDGVTAYYEPFNERRWFEPGARERPVDPTHRHVDEYWHEYTRLHELGRWYREDWTARRLWMDADAWDPDMRRYVDILIERAKGRAVLQFNHIDFRLGWFRRQFPRAKLVHLYRHPRDQWCSSLLDTTTYNKNASVAAFRQHDHFYLLAWCCELKYQFPFLDESRVEHAYELFYFIWKLSYLLGAHYADYSLSFESLVDDPSTQLTRLLRSVGMEPAGLDSLSMLIDAPAAGKWRAYADDEWFVKYESRCEATLAEFLPGSWSALGRQNVAV
jgi:hypothetical protein